MSEQPVTRPTTAERFDLSGRTAIVTGGSRGLGRAIALGLAEAGADVVIASRKLDACRAAADEIAEATGRKTLALACHVGRWADCDRLIDEVTGHFGRLDVLVNNAGMSPLYPDLASVGEELYDKTLAVNLKGPFRLAALASTRMAQSGGGSIINVSTIGSVIASPNELPYACAKAGLNAMTAGMAAAFAPKVRVNAILPGAFGTDVARWWTDEQRAGSSIPMRRIGEPGEVVDLVVYLASPASSYTTGALIRVDGGAAGAV